MALAQVSLDDKYARETGRIYLSGTQALVRLLLAQKIFLRSADRLRNPRVGRRI